MHDYPFILLYLFLFFFFKQKTAYEVRISDWSSDVCSSDLGFHDGKILKGYSQSSSSIWPCPIRIFPSWKPASRPAYIIWTRPITNRAMRRSSNIIGNRSEERRVGKECDSKCRYRGSADH